MIFPLCIAIGIVATVAFNIYFEGFDFLETILMGLLGSLLGFLAAVLLWLGLAGLPGAQPVVADTYTTEIHALVDNARYSSATSGSVFLIQHRTDETLKYSYMYMCDGKGYAFKEVDANQCYINYTNETPKLVYHRRDCQSAFLRWLLPDFYEDEYVFYVPYDAEIIDDFEIDFN